MSSSPSESALAGLMRVEAARYALLRRLAYSIRHQMVAHLQPIGMVTELLERRLRAPAPDLAQVHENVSRINGLSKAAAQDCLDVITWMAPEPGATMAADAAVQDTVSLLRGNFSFRGFSVRNEVAETSQPLDRAAARMLLPAVLFALTDAMEGPAEITLSSRAGEDVLDLTMSVQRSDAEPGLASELSYRAITWAEVQALCRAEDVALTHTETSATLSFPILD